MGVSASARLSLNKVDANGKRFISDIVHISKEYLENMNINYIYFSVDHVFDVVITGVGYYINFTDEEIGDRELLQYLGESVLIELEGLELILGLIIYLVENEVKCIEVFTNGPGSLDDFPIIKGWSMNNK